MENIMKSLNLKEGTEVEYKSAKGGFPGSFWDTFSAFAVCRNPLLQKMFVFVGVGEKAGSGADVISTGWRENGWQLPTLVEHQMPARVEATLLIEDLVKQQEGETIQKSGLETENDTENGLKSGLETESDQKSDQKSGLKTESDQKSDQKSGLETESNQKSDQKSDQKILEAISKNSVITIKELQELTGLSESGVKKIIRNLRADNQIRRVGPDKGGHWEIVAPSSELDN